MPLVSSQLAQTFLAQARLALNSAPAHCRVISTITIPCLLAFSYAHFSDRPLRQVPIKPLDKYT